VASKKKLSVKELERRSRQRQAQGLNKNKKSRIDKNGVLKPPYNNMTHFSTITTLPNDASDMIGTATYTVVTNDLLWQLRARRYLNRLLQNRAY